jgi:hypothetical protein
MLRSSYIIAALVVLLLAITTATLAFAQPAESVIARTSMWFEVWTIVQPLVALFISIVGPVLITWIAGRLIMLLKVTDDAKKLEIEQRLRDALHQSASNAVAYARSRLIGTAADFGKEALINAAVEYVREKNSDALTKLKVSDAALADIITAKIGSAIK